MVPANATQGIADAARGVGIVGGVGKEDGLCHEGLLRRVQQKFDLYRIERKFKPFAFDTVE